MKKIVVAALGVVSLLLISFSSPAFAQLGKDYSPCAGGNSVNLLCKINVSNPGGVVGAIISFVLFLAVFIAFIFLVIGGLRWITSGGDKSAVESARNTIIAAIIGLVVAFLAYLIITLILGFLGLTFETLTLPKLPGA